MIQYHAEYQVFKNLRQPIIRSLQMSMKHLTLLKRQCTESTKYNNTVRLNCY